jgi:hypothetical protein
VIDGGHSTFLIGKDMSFFSQNAMEFIKKYQPIIDVEVEV